MVVGSGAVVVAEVLVVYAVVSGGCLLALGSKLHFITNITLTKIT